VVRILSTILGPDEGSASVLGYDVVSQADAVRRTIGLAGQYAAVDENLTGRENLHMVGRLSHLSRKVSSRRADELLEDFGLSGAGDRVLKTYSGGMRRRLDLAAALVANPPVLFLDEPTTGLDPQSRQALWVAIEELVRDGTTVLLTTQYLEEADRLARDIVVIDHGRVIAEGTPAQLKAGLGTSVVSVTLGDRDALDKAVQLLTPFSDKAPLIEDLVIELTVTDGPKAGADVLRSLDAAQITLAGLALREPSLDDVFLNLTGHKTVIEEDAEDTAAKPKRGLGRARKSDVADGKDAA
jgi:ABC-type multidrug transport system ATPase subunit